ncbi:unnamed protein product [Heligmosomoides polygyrus]|uniref:RUN domain-containing protein n=1 Tax=Heligmosomoides polygyrus TaxID=6339 RepID=A0A183G7A0_HELPZ|nr:unnamed protein product [Heligmosomoides polygyrus]
MTGPVVQRSQREAMALTVNEIIAHLVEAHREHKDVNLNRLKCVMSASPLFFGGFASETVLSRWASICVK